MGGANHLHVSLGNSSASDVSDASTITRLRNATGSSGPTQILDSTSMGPAAQGYMSPEKAPQQSVDNFDYATFMWTGGDWWNAMDAEPFPSNLAEVLSLSAWDTTQALTNWNPESTSDVAASPSSLGFNPSEQETTSEVPVPPVQALCAEDQMVLDSFSLSALPPILATIETKLRWSHIKQSLLRMTENSSLVRSAVLAFSNLSLRQSGDTSLMTLPGEHYRSASHALDQQRIASTFSNKQNRKEILATCFFLAYVDILEGESAQAQKILEMVYSLFVACDKKSLLVAEIRWLSWIRLLDAKMVAAGGEGLLLSDNEFVNIMAQSTSNAIASPMDTAVDSSEVVSAEELVFQTLCQPGVQFFQKVQSFMGRIANIDPWHRSRGTVADETEVMMIAADISKDLETVFASRPPLMDFVLNGQDLFHVLDNRLARSITKVFRTYACNYHACKVHLHRVAYKSLPVPEDTQLALAKIRELVRSMVDELSQQTGTDEDLEDTETLPVSMLWPLMMLAAEEGEHVDREWTLSQIVRIGRITTNARMSAQVIREVQRRQDLTGLRVDIRSVMHDICHQGFAVV